MSNEITKNKKKFPIGLIICLAVVIVCAGVTAGTLIFRNVSSSQEIEMLQQMEAADEETLRKILAADGTCTVTLTEDIVVSEELDVNGTKTLVGDKSVIMDTSNIGKGESVCSIVDGANLILDGATIDGNGVVNGVSVKIGGKFTGISGNVVYGYPYGLTIAGTAEMKGITIDRTMHTGLYVEYGGEAHMTGGVIKNNVYGLAVASGGYMSISEDAVLTKSNATIVTNYGKMEIIGGNYTDCFDNVITNQGEMSIIGTDNEKIELANSKRSAIVSKKNSKLTVKNCDMHDLGLHAIAIEKGSEGSIESSVIERTGKSSFYSNSSTFAIKDVEVSGGESYGLSAVKQSKIEMENVVIKDMKSRGLGIDESQLKAKNVEVRDTKSTGLYVVGEKAVVEVEDLTLVKNGASALGIKSGKVTAKKVTIEEPKNEGVYVGEEGKLNIEDAKIDKTGMHSFMNYGTANGKNIKITNSNKIGIKSSDKSSLTVKDVVIKNTASHALCVEKDSAATVTNCDIDNAGKKEKKAAVYVSKSRLNMKKSTVDDAATYAIAVKDCKKADDKVVNLNDITITKTGDHGIGNIGSYVVAGNIKVSETKRAGIYTEGKDSRTNMNQIEVVNAGTCGFGFKAGEITARNVTITTPKNEGVYVLKDANVKQLDNVTVIDPGSQGVSVDGGIANITVDKKYNPDNTKENGVTVLNSKSSAIKCVNGGSITAQNVTIKNAKNHAFDVEKESYLKVTGCEIDKTGKASVYVVASRVNMKDAKINNSASYGIAVKDTKEADGRVANFDNIMITNAGERGIGNFDSYVVAGNIKIFDSKGAGIYTEGTASRTNMNQIEIKGSGKSGFAFKAGEVTARNVTITNPAEEGIVVQKDANVKKLDNVTIENPGAHGIFNNGGIINITVDKKYNPDNLTGNGITIKNPAHHGIFNEKETNGTITLAHANIINAGEYGIWNRSGKVTGNNVTIDKTVKAGIAISQNAVVNLDNANIIKAGEQGVLCDGLLSVTNSINAENGLTITEPTAHGIYLSSTGSVASVGMNIVDAGGKGILSESGSLDASKLTLTDIKSQGLEIKGGKAVVSNFNIGKTGSAAIKASNGSEVELTDGTINAHTYAIATEGKEGNVSKLTATDVKIVRAIKENKNQLVSAGAYSEFVLNETAEQKSVIDGNYTASTTEFSGRGVDVIGTFVMNGGTICHNKAESGAGVNVQAGATFNMNGGTIKENAATTYGAGVYVKGTFNMNAGTVSNHGSKNSPLAVEGTGVCISGDSAVFTMNGGEISNNYANNKAGAGVSLRDGKPTFTMNGGKITANHTTGNVGGMVIRGAATFTMNEGAIISDNTAGTGKVGGGISMDGTATFVLNGGAFSGNTTGNVNNDINLASGSAHIKLSKQLTSDIYVSHHKSTYATTIQVAAKHNDISDEHFQNSMKYIVMQPKGTGDWFVNVDGYLAKAVALLQSNGGNTRYATLESAVSAAAEGETIKILENVEIANPITKALTFTSDKAVTIKAADNMKNIMFSIAKGKTMNITGAAADKKISIDAGQSGKNAIQSYGTVNLTNVSTSGGQRGLYIGGGTATLTNVSISSCTGEGLRVDAGGVNVTASGLYIDNTGSNGVYLKGASGNKATGTITNFEIKETKSAAVKVQNSDLELKNGRIETATYSLVTSDASSQLTAEGVTVKTTYGKPFSINGSTPTSYQGVTFEQ